MAHSPASSALTSLPHASSLRDAELIKHRGKFTFTFDRVCKLGRSQKECVVDLVKSTEMRGVFLLVRSFSYGVSPFLPPFHSTVETTGPVFLATLLTSEVEPKEQV
jgi:hypothetical protein